MCAERQADSEFAGPRRHEIADDAVQAHGGEPEAEGAEQRREGRREPLALEGAVELLRQRGEASHPDPRRHFGEQSSQRRRDRRRVSRRLHRQREVGPVVRPLRVRHEDHRVDGRSRSVESCVRDDAEDRHLVRKTELTPDGAGASEIAAREGLVDDRDAQRAVLLRLGEGASRDEAEPDRLEEAARHVIELRERLVRGRHISRYADRVAQVGAPEDRRIRGEAHRPGPRNHGRPRQQARVERRQRTILVRRGARVDERDHRA